MSETTKTIFITGGATGIGAASVSKFMVEGWNVAFMDINVTEARRLLETIPSQDRILFIEGNTRRKEDVDMAVRLTLARFGSIHSVFANAGIHRRNTLLDITDEELQLLIDTNIYGTVNTLRLTVPHIIEAGGGSVVINCSDQWFVGKRHSFGYGLTKGALGQITRSLAIDLGPDNVRVNAICPGTIRTPLVDSLFERFAAVDNTTVQEMWREENALFARGKAGEPGEVAELVYFLASDKATFITGSHYLIDGGLVAGS